MEAINLNQAKSKRTVLRSWLTKLKNYTDELSNLTELDINALKSKLERLNTRNSEFNDIQSIIEIESEDFETQTNIRFEVEDQIDNIRGKIETILNSSVNQSSLNNNSNNNSRNSNFENIKLPVIELQTFDGDYTKFKSFYDSFLTLIHNNNTLSDVQKLCYLRSSLKGDALNVVRSLDTTEINYEIALNLIQTRYNNKRRIIYSHVNAILKATFSSLKSFCNLIEQHLQCLKSLEIPIDSWQAILVPLILNKVDSSICKDWETHISQIISKQELPSHEKLISFLLERAEISEASKDHNKFNNAHHSQQQKLKTKAFALTSNSNKLNCPFCKGNHPIYSCNDFLKKEIADRIKSVKELKICLNCLKGGHYVKDCASSKCKICKKSHNSLLHIVETNEQPTALSKTITNSEDIEQRVASNCATKVALYSQTLLPTAEVLVHDRNGKAIKTRALLDSGSQSNFITEELFNSLSLNKHNTAIEITGIGHERSNIKHCATINITSKFSKEKFPLSVLILPKITHDLPQITFDINDSDIPKNINLADESFNIAAPIHILLGSNIFWKFIQNGQLKLNSENLGLQNTKLGWIVTGNLLHNQSSNQITCLSLKQNIEKFWEIEEFNSNKKYFSDEETMCESNFVNTTTRDKTGRFIVTLPLKENHTLLGESQELAIKRFLSLENRLLANKDVKKTYNSFMQEYIDLGHMVKIDVKPQEFSYFIPHHHIMKESSTTTKLRVVFDGSMKTSSGLSLNNVLGVGSTVQQDLFSILLKFRRHNFIAIADIEKMYRQIQIHPKDRYLQRIIWRNDPSESLQCYELNTVTYGTASAPYLATRCLYQLGVETEKEFPIESNIIKNDFYVDDLLTGADTICALSSICSNINKILTSAGFHLRKWTFNNSDIIINKKNIVSNDQPFELVIDNTKTLGIIYNPKSDVFKYSFNNIKIKGKHTKREILRKTAAIYDPIGLLTPITIVPKLILQTLWRERIDWNATIPHDLKSQWKSFENGLFEIDEIQTARCLKQFSSNNLEMHGFADASQIAYGACLYLKSFSKNNTPHIQLISAKSRVAPLKQITLPRLELCAALLLAQLANKVKEILDLPLRKEILWSDSQITLAWINSSPHKWHTFVANRVADIQRLTNPSQWHHIESDQNPADLISRGADPQTLKHSQLWWHGPNVLLQNVYNSRENYADLDVPEQRITNINLKIETHSEFHLFKKYSKLSTLINVFARCVRFINLCKKQPRNSGNLTINERAEALTKLIKIAQTERFNKEIKCLIKNKPLFKRSNILKLSPFLDKNHLLRVGGRLKNAQVSLDTKHQIILPQNHNLTHLIAINEHKLNLHCGSQQLLYILREQYWPIAGTSLTKSITRKCITCVKYNPKPHTQLMADLPYCRVNQSLPFLHCGIDFAGPFNSRDRRSRGYKTFKVYICLFICMSTKAIHIEIVSDLSSSAFMASLRRFVARRGKPKSIYSDNGTNFVGCNKELSRLCKALADNKSGFKNLLIKHDLNIEWHFLPPRSPHHGGLWESHIKIVKRHLAKVIGQSILTFEEFSTVALQIEAVVNSRPLTPLSNDPNDYNPLTPAHFLIGRSLTQPADENFMGVPENRLSTYQRMQRMTQHFWKRWHHEYVNHLQPRGKWRSANDRAIQVGQLVILLEPNTPPGQWPMGRITQLWPGADNKIRVVSVKTSDNTYKRNITSIGILPIDS